jgi:hypothetical protein
MAATADRTTAAHMINAFRVVSVISIPLMGQFPSVSVLTASSGLDQLVTSILPLPGPQLVRLDGHRSDARANFRLAARRRPSDLAYPASVKEHGCEARDIPGIH